MIEPTHAPATRRDPNAIPRHRNGNSAARGPGYGGP